MNKKFLLSLGVVVTVVAGVAAMSAYEAHVINVTAHIENALSVSTTPIDFGIVFPQEYVTEEFTVELSSSFLAEDRADDVEYIIKQKPKPNQAGIDHHNGDLEAAREYCHTATLPDAYCYLSLCPYLSKMDGDPDDQNDIGVPSYYQGTTCVTPSPDYAVGRLAKSQNDFSDLWIIDLKVPPVKGYVGQDWPADCPTVDENDRDYGCDLWIEVTGISEIARPNVGADLASYVPPEQGECNIIVGSGQTHTTIQVGIDAATVGQTVCVENGTYSSDTYPLRVNKDNLTLAALNGPTTSVILPGGVIIDNDGVTVTGFQIGNSTTLGETFGVYVNTGVDDAKVTYNIITGPGVGSGRGVVNVIHTTTGLLVDNNVISNWLTGVFLNNSSGMEVRYNTLTDNGVGSGNDYPTNNTIHHNVIKNNTLEGVGYLGDGSSSLAVNVNNIYGNPAGKDVISYGGAQVDAEDNWWGDNNPGDNVSGNVDYTPWESSPYPEN